MSQRAATITSLPMAFEIVKAMQADGLDWGEGYRPLGRRALEKIIEDQMAAAVDRYLDRLKADDPADRRNGYLSYRNCSPMNPNWLHVSSVAYLFLGAISALIISGDLLRHPQHMWIMNMVWPLTALVGTVWILSRYFRYGRLASRKQVHAAKDQQKQPPDKRLTPFPIMVANGTLHCIAAAAAR